MSQRVLSDLKESVGDPKYFMGASPLKALAYSMSGVSYMLHAHIGNVAKYQLMPDTAEGDSLRRWAKIFDLQPQTSSRAMGSISSRVRSRLE